MRRHFPRAFPRVFVAIIKISKKKTPKSKPKRKPGTRAGLTKSGIAADATKLIETVGPGKFSVRKTRKRHGGRPDLDPRSLQGRH